MFNIHKFMANAQKSILPFFQKSKILHLSNYNSDYNIFHFSKLRIVPHHEYQSSVIHNQNMFHGNTYWIYVPYFT